MMTTSLNQDQAEALANLVHQVRTDWDIKGIKTALWNAKDRGTAAEVAHAALYAAEDTSIRTPAVIALAGPHWTRGRELTSTGAVPGHKEPRCEEHPWERANNCRAHRSEALEATEQERALTRVGVPRERVQQILAGAGVPDVRRLAAGEKD